MPPGGRGARSVGPGLRTPRLLRGAEGAGPAAALQSLRDPLLQVLWGEVGALRGGLGLGRLGAWHAFVRCCGVLNAIDGEAKFMVQNDTFLTLCSDACAEPDWPRHRKACRAIRLLRAAAAAEAQAGARVPGASG